jgi:signal transduction histidine kinase
MGIFIWGFIFLATGIVLTISILGIPLFLKAPKNQPTIIWAIGIFLSSCILITATVLLINNAPNIDAKNDALTYRALFVLLAPTLFFCFFLQALLVRSIRKSILDRTSLLFLMIFIGTLVIGTNLLSKVNPARELGLIFLQSDIFFTIFRSIVNNLFALWLFYEARKILAIKDNFLISLIQALAGFLASLGLLWMVFLIIDYVANLSLSNQLGGLTSLDLNSRIIRLGIFCVLEILLTIYWVQNYSLNVIDERQSQEKIQNLLHEKELLIVKLANSRTLIESGALSAGLAHELNQYLARIELNSDEVLQLIDQAGVKPEDLKQPLGNILKANHLAAKLIVSLKKLFNRGEEHSSLYGVDDLVREIIGLYSFRLQKSQIQVDLDLRVGEQQNIWESLFRQVVVNLLTNAIDALDASSQNNKVIQIRSSLNEQGRYCLVITDNGPGIHAEQEAKLFNLFASSKPNGTGVGLWLSHYIVERHQGTLTYKNLPDVSGVSFIVTIPSGLKTKKKRGGNGGAGAIS